MRCKFCDKRLEPHQYKWDEEKKEFVEVCGGRCVLSNEDRRQIEQAEDDAAAEVDDGIVQRWVPKRN